MNELLKHLVAKRKALDFKEKAKAAPHVLDRCEQLDRSFSSLLSQLENIVSRSDEEKGIRAGLKVAAGIVLQHKVMLNQECKDEKITKQQFLDFSGVVDRCTRSVTDALTKQGESVIRSLGKAEGLALAAESMLSQIKANLDNLQSQQNFAESNPDLNLVDIPKQAPNISKTVSIKRPRKKKAAGKKK